LRIGGLDALQPSPSQGGSFPYINPPLSNNFEGINDFSLFILMYPVIIIRVRASSNFIVRSSILSAFANLFVAPVHTSDNPIEVYSPFFLSVFTSLTEFLWVIVSSNSYSVPSRVVLKELFHIHSYLRCLV